MPQEDLALLVAPNDQTVKHLFYHNNGNRTFTNVFDKVITAEKDVEDPATKTKKRVRQPAARRRARLRRGHRRPQ